MATRTVIVIKTEVFSRVVGYYRPVDEWNPGKRDEFKERVYIKVPEEELTNGAALVCV